MYDLLIKNGKIADGSGDLACYAADIAIKDGKIVRVGQGLDGETERVIDANGLIVSPGFIDHHSHSDYSMIVDHNFANMVEQGITTEIVGQCGGTLAPMSYQTLKNMAAMYGHEGEDFETLSEKLKTFDNYVKFLESRDLGDNWAFYAGHSTIRTHVVGYENRPPTKDELEIMKDHVRNAMEAGALGITTGLIYPPGSYADTDEIVELIKVVAEYGGTYCSHMRSEGDTIIESIKEVIEIGERAGVPVNISHFKLLGKKNWHKLEEVFKLIDKARSKGMKIRADMYPYLAGATGLISALPNKFASAGSEKIVENLKNKDFRKTVWEELQIGSGFENLIEYCGFDGIMLLTAPVTKELIGKMVTEIAEERRKSPFDTFCDLIMENKGGAMAGYFFRKEEHTTEMFKQPYVMGGTDGGIESSIFPMFHPRHMGTFPQLIRKFVKEQRIFTIEEAVHKLSYIPADMAGLKTKGLIKEDYDADIAIFDLEKLTDHADYINPKAKNEGMKNVIVNGRVVVENDDFIRIHVGKVLRKR